MQLGQRKFRIEESKRVYGFVYVGVKLGYTQILWTYDNLS
jgi:hypothetical protein